MKWLFIALLVIFILISIIIFTKIKVILNYEHHNDDDHLTIQFRAMFGLIKYKIELPIIKIDDNSPTIVVKQKKSLGEEDYSRKKDTKQYSYEDLLNSLHDTKELILNIVSLNVILQKFLKKVSVKKFEWHTVVGIGDAASTGVLAGAFWAIKGGIIGLISHFLKLQTDPIITVTPQFQLAVSQTKLSCIIQFRIGHAMLAGIKTIKFWKGGKPMFKSKPLSVLSNSKTKSV